jgi:hypothetical protein
VQDRLNVTRGEIEQIEGRIALLDNQTEFSTVTVFLVLPAGGADSGGISNPAEAAERGFEASLEVLAGAATAAVAVLAFTWWLVPVWLVVGWFVWRKYRAPRPQAPQSPAA